METTYDLNIAKDVFGKIFENVDECIEEFHIARTNIYNCCNGKQKSCRGFGFRYYES